LKHNLKKENKMAKKTWLRGAALALIAVLALAGCNKKAGAQEGSSGGGSSVNSAVKEAPESDFTVELTKDSTGVKITKYNGNAKAVQIPATIQGMPVREVGGFGYNKTITSVIIPEGVIQLGWTAFSNCENLTSVKFPTTLTEITYGAFEKTKLTAVDLSETSVTNIGKNAFQECKALTSVALPASISVIEDYAFSRNPALTTVTIPEAAKIKFFYMAAFLGCKNIPIATQAKLKEFGYNGSF
jgi:hypothetical protein